MPVNTVLITLKAFQRCYLSLLPPQIHKKMFQRFFSTVQPSNSSFSVGEEVVDSNTTLKEKLQNIVDKCNKAEMCSNAERNQRFGKELAVFESTKEKTNNISKLYEALKSVKRQK